MQEVGGIGNYKSFPYFGWRDRRDRYMSLGHDSEGSKVGRVRFHSQCYRPQERSGDILGKHGLLKKGQKNTRIVKIGLNNFYPFAV